MRKKTRRGESLVVQWLRFLAPNAGGPGLNPGQGTRGHMLQLRVRMSQTKILHTSRKIKDPMGCNQDPAQPNK